MKLAASSAALTSVILQSLLLEPIHARAVPLPTPTHPKRPTYLNSSNDVLIFDSPGFQNPAHAHAYTRQTEASVQAFVFEKDIDMVPLNASVVGALNSIGFHPSEDDLATALERLKLFAAVGIPDATVKVQAERCIHPSGIHSQLPPTSEEDLGLTTSFVSLGYCGAAAALGGGEKIGLRVIGDDFSSANVFLSSEDGFGVISDIDDTVKITHTLDTLQLVQATLFEPPTPVTGMPEVYASLAQSLHSPQFLYVSGSPYQLYPFLREFIDTSFSDSTGPLFLRNITVSDISTLFQQLTSSDGDATLDYKVEQITRIHEMYPGKKFLAVGDSTEKDPEVYAKIFNTFGGHFIRCIWIHVVEGADNSEERFNTAFEGIPQERIRLYTDEQIAELVDVDVAGGQC